MLVRERAFWTCFSKRFCSRLASFAETLSLLPGTAWTLAAETASLEIVLGEVRVPDVQRLHGRELLHRLAVGADRGFGDAV